MGFSLKHILYFHMPRTAGDSIRKSISNFPKMCKITTHHSQANAIQNIKQHSTYSHHKSFTFVRNPYNRLYSSYNWIMNRDTSRNEDLSGIDLLEYDYLKGFNDFNDFATNVGVDGINKKFMIHFHPCSKWIWDSKILITNFFKFEDLFSNDNSFLHWCKDNGLNYQGLVDETHKSKWTERNYFDYFNSESIFNINKLYKKDFELFGYEKI